MEISQGNQNESEKSKWQCKIQDDKFSLIPYVGQWFQIPTKYVLFATNNNFAYKTSWGDFETPRGVWTDFQMNAKWSLLWGGHLRLARALLSPTNRYVDLNSVYYVNFFVWLGVTVYLL